jgi:hypothetical protein
VARDRLGCTCSLTCGMHGALACAKARAGDPCISFCKVFVQKVVAVAACVRENSLTAHVLPDRRKLPRSDGHDRTRRPGAQRGQRHSHQLSVACSGSSDGGHGQRKLAAIGTTRRRGLDLLPQARAAYAAPRGPVGPCRPGLHDRHPEPVGRRGRLRRHRDGRVRTADQRAAPRAARRGPGTTTGLGPARTGAARVLHCVRRCRSQPEGPGPETIRGALRGRARTPGHQRPRRFLGLHPARPRRKGRLGPVPSHAPPGSGRRGAPPGIRVARGFITFGATPPGRAPALTYTLLGYGTL